MGDDGAIGEGKVRWANHGLRLRDLHIQRPGGYCVLFTLWIFLGVGVQCSLHRWLKPWGNESSEFYAHIKDAPADRVAPFTSKGVILDSALYLINGVKMALPLADQTSGPYRIRVVFRKQELDVFRMYFGKSAAAQYFLAYSDQYPEDNGIYRKTSGGPVRLSQRWRLPDTRKIPGLLEISLEVRDGGVQGEIQGYRFRQPLPDADLAPHLLVEVAYPGHQVLLDRAELYSLRPDGSAVVLGDNDFHAVPLYYDIWLQLGVDPNGALGRALSLLLLSLAALLFDLALLALAPRLRWLGLSPAGLLLACLPLQAGLVVLLRGALGLPFMAYYASLLLLAIGKLVYLLLPGGRTAIAARVDPATWRAALFLAAGLVFHAWLAFLLWPIPNQAGQGLALIKLVLIFGPLCVLLGVALMTRGFPFAIYPLAAAPSALLYWMNQSFQLGPSPPELVLAAAPVSFAALLHTTRAPRWGRLVSLPLKACSLVLLFFCVEALFLDNPRLNVAFDHETLVNMYGWSIEENTNLFGQHDVGPNIVTEGGVTPRDKPRGVVRIVCLGSSSTHGTGATDERWDSYPPQLEQALSDRTAAEAEVIRAGLFGSPFYLIGMHLTEVMFKVSPDVVILYYGSNGDNWEAIRYYDEVKAEVDAADHINTREELWAAMQLRWNPEWLINAFLLGARSRVIMALVEGVSWLKDRLSPPAEVAGGNDSDPAFLTGGVERVIRACVQRGIKVLLIPEICYEDLRAGAGVPADKRTHPYYTIFEKLARKYAGKGVYHASLFERFARAPWTEYIFDRMHLTDEGYRFLAQQIADVLLEKEIVRAK